MLQLARLRRGLLRGRRLSSTVADTRRVLLLGGTGLARRTAELVHRDARVHIVSSLAGRVAAPRLPPGEVRIGGFGGPDGLASWLRANRIGRVLVGVHPFAARMTASAHTAASALRLPLALLRPPGWTPVAGDRWTWAADLAEAASLTSHLGSRVLLSVGRGGSTAFADVADPWFLVRSVDEPRRPLPPRHQVVTGRGPFTVADERSLLASHRINLLVTRDSGGPDAKLVAARELGVSVLLVRRPPTPVVPVLGDEDAAVRWIRS